MGLVQALVFMLLTAVFTLLICQHEKEAPDAAHETEDMTVRRSTARRGLPVLKHRKGKQNMSTLPLLAAAAEMGGSIHVGLAAMGAGVGVGLIGMGASAAVGRNPGAATKILVQAILTTAFAEAIVFYAMFLVK